MEKGLPGEEQHQMKGTATKKSLARRTGLLLALTAAGLVLTSGVALANQVPCNRSPDLPCGALEGPANSPSEGNDVFSGSGFNDSMSGYGGDDEGYGHGGNDTMMGMEGNDAFDGGTGNDVLGKGHDLDDAMDPGRDSFYGGEGNDFILARDGVDDLFIGCGEGLEDVVEVDHGLGEWRDVVNCEIIWDGVGPSISAWGPPRAPTTGRRSYRRTPETRTRGQGSRRPT